MSRTVHIRLIFLKFFSTVRTTKFDQNPEARKNGKGTHNDIKFFDHICFGLLIPNYHFFVTKEMPVNKIVIKIINILR